MRVLIDTNIFIDRENYRVLPENLRELLRILNKLGVEILVHPRSIDEIEKDRNEDRKKIALSKIHTYKFLESPPDPFDDDCFTNIAGFPSSINDSVDNAMLYAVYKNAVDFLISEDRGIHNKALKLALSDRVLSSEEALTIFEKDLIKEKVRHPPALKSEFVYNLNLEDQFFDSLKNTYPEFEVWFKKICRQGRKCWVYLEDNSIGALLIYKVENDPINSTPPLSAKNRLKLSTFKVAHTGFKIGELLIRLSVQYCIKNNLAEMYLTHFTKEEDHFANLLTEYGFSKAAKIDGEDIYLKKLVPDKEMAKSLSPLRISRDFYPSFYDGPLVKKYVVPIRPEYHDRLFVDYAGRQTTLPEHVGDFIIEGNTITKVYLSHSKTRKISEGDVLLFYRSWDARELTSIGVVEKTFVGFRNRDDVVRLVGKRTVYRVAEIKEIVRKPTLVIFFRLHFHFPKPIKLSTLKSMGILRNAPQTITKIPYRKYLQIKREGELDERYTFD